MPLTVPSHMGPGPCFRKRREGDDSFLVSRRRVDGILAVQSVRKKRKRDVLQENVLKICSFCNFFLHNLKKIGPGTG